jgi:hypothetical protein
MDDDKQPYAHATPSRALSASVASSEGAMVPAVLVRTVHTVGALCRSRKGQIGNRVVAAPAQRQGDEGMGSVSIQQVCDYVDVSLAVLFLFLGSSCPPVWDDVDGQNCPAARLLQPVVRRDCSRLLSCAPFLCAFFFSEQASFGTMADFVFECTGTTRPHGTDKTRIDGSAERAVDPAELRIEMGRDRQIP